MEPIDILLATYNGEKYLSEQIDSILKQTYKNFRLIISDDYSSDNTKKILEEYKLKDDRIIVYYQNENLGYVKNFEFLLSKVENEFYALADQDDIWLENKIEVAINTLKENDADLYFSDLTLINDNGEIIGNSFWKEKGFYKKVLKDNKYKGLLLNNYVTGCTIVTKKKFLDNILPIPQNTKYMIHDYWMAIVTCMKGKIIYDKQPYIKYRQHTDNQVGYKMKSKELNSLNEIRNMFIEVKIEHFNIFIQHEDLFTKEIQIQNKKALKYYERLKQTKKINFRNWGLFYKLYKPERNFKYIIANFVILNIPMMAKLIYKRGNNNEC